MIRLGCLLGVVLFTACSSEDPLKALIEGEAGRAQGGRSSSTSGAGGSVGTSVLTGSGGRRASIGGSPVASGGAVASAGGYPGFAGSPGTGGVIFGGTGGQVGDSSAPVVCSLVTQSGAPPVDMLILVDQSSSMSDALETFRNNASKTWWEAVQNGITTFLKSPQAMESGVGVGIQYFPLNGMAPQSCPPDDYTTPEVEIGMLPANVGPIAASLQKHFPAAFRPTGPALFGALSHMKDWGKKNPDRVPVVVLITDGLPSECNPQDLASLVQWAEDAFETPPAVRTFVLGLNLGPDGDQFTKLSIAGGGGEAVLSDGFDVAAQVTSTLASVAGSQLSCAVDLPPTPTGTQVNTQFLNVTLTPYATMVSTVIPEVKQAADCMPNSNYAWYFDSPAKPTKIELCPAACAELATSQFQIQLGCIGLGNTMR